MLSGTVCGDEVGVDPVRYLSSTAIVPADYAAVFLSKPSTSSSKVEDRVCLLRLRAAQKELSTIASSHLPRWWTF